MPEYGNRHLPHSRLSLFEPRRDFLKAFTSALVVGIFSPAVVSANALFDKKVVNDMNTSATGLTQRSVDEDPQNLVLQYGNYLQAGNLPEILKLYHPDAEIIPSNLPSLTGLEKIKTFYEETFQTIKIIGALNITHGFVDGTVCCVRCEEPAEIKIIATGEVLKSYFRELFVLRKLENEWKIHSYFFSENPSQANS